MLALIDFDAWYSPASQESCGAQRSYENSLSHSPAEIRRKLDPPSFTPLQTHFPFQQTSP